VRNDVWQAFSNPDLGRKRYVNIQTRQVVHFLHGDGSASEKRVTESPATFLEITPVGASTQTQWMREYVESLDARPQELAALRALVALPYSSQLNATFTKALSEHAGGWKRLRVTKILEVITSWAALNNIPVQTLLEPPSDAPESAPPASGIVGDGTARDTARKLLDLLSDDDLRHVVMPVIYTTLLIRSRP
jgi:hypothetical protein